MKIFIIKTRVKSKRRRKRKPGLYQIYTDGFAFNDQIKEFIIKLTFVAVSFI